MVAVVAGVVGRLAVRHGSWITEKDKHGKK